MRKKLVLCVIIVMLILCSCGNLKEPQKSDNIVTSNTYTENTTDTNNASNDNFTSSVPNNITTEEASNSETFVPEEPYNSAASEVFVDPEWAGQEYGYFAETDNTFQTFIDWSKNYGKVEDYNYGLEWNKTFLEWVADSKELLLPIILNDTYHFNNMSVNPYRNSYCMVYTGGKNNPVNEKLLSIVVRPQIDENIKLSVEEHLIKLKGTEFTDNRDMYKKVIKNFKWRSYHVDEYWCIPSEGTAFVKLGNYQISITVYGYKNCAEWNEKFFEYIDFETVSLKD